MGYSTFLSLFIRDYIVYATFKRSQFYFVRFDAFLFVCLKNMILIKLFLRYSTKYIYLRYFCTGYLVFLIPLFLHFTVNEVLKRGLEILV